ncbi:winged helix-turn-helix domain-containing protein [Agromyces sp. SYSU K20354]|uniref:nSTAND1 domain-containing NTPase n=1 Tax=Agromyces cavernae TaxID=2898659 RepID=UPI001E6375F3|nr:BTAD domain-containing putative transcriptional regulator [Agromyces cavernae]MCD2442546.1 winged helix-turn-helix domain-containing protein [Agromyces cavernae]
MSVSVLGAVVVDGSPISPRERAVLAALVLRAGSALSPDELADALWGENPPATWTKQVQIAVARLRRHAGVPPIETVAEGYRVEVAPDSIDAVRFERLVDAGLTHARDGDPDRAESEFSRALELWRGRAYADLPDWPPAVAEAQRLVGLRAVAEEERARMRLELGRDAGVVTEAERLVQESPLREPRWGILALALYRSNRQADALAAIREARRRLDDELGIDLSDELAALETAILRHDPTLDGAPAPEAGSDTACPYRGLDAFDVDDEAEFFGRSRDILAALARVDRSRFVALAGASGCGKSSLARAGVVPALRRQRRRVDIILPRRSSAMIVRDRVTSVRAGDVLVVDQFEELLHLDLVDGAVDDLCAALAEFMHGGGTLLLTVRSDFLDECARLPHLGPAFTDGVHLVPPIGSDGLREAIEGPARQAGLRLEPGLTELILRDAAGQAGALPLVSHALVETWLRRDGSTLTVAGYEESGGLSGAIAQSADRLYQRMSPAERALCRSTMLRLVSLSADGSPVRRTLAIKSLHDDDARDRVLTMLEAARLVSADESTIVVSHEALADAWPRLRGWLEEDADAQRTMHALSNAAESWDADGRPAEDLYRGGRLQTALDWATDDRDLTSTEREFLDASAALESSDRRALAQREHHERRQNRRLRALLVAASALILLLVGAGTFAGVSANEAERQRAAASIEALVSTALSLRTSERDVAALLAAEAYRRWPDDPRTRSGLMGVLTSAEGFLGNAFVPDTEGIFGAVIPATDRAFTMTMEGSADIRDLETGEVVRSLEGSYEFSGWAPYPLVEVSADARVGVVLWPAETDQVNGPAWYGTSLSADLLAFDLESGARVLGPMRIDQGVGALAVSHDGSTIAVGDASDGRVVLYDLTGDARDVTGQSLVELTRTHSPSHSRSTRSAACSPEGWGTAST